MKQQLQNTNLPFCLNLITRYVSKFRIIGPLLTEIYSIGYKSIDLLIEQLIFFSVLNDANNFKINQGVYFNKTFKRHSCLLYM